MRRILGRLFILAAFLPALLQAEPSYITFPADIHWRTQETQHFRSLFRAGQEAASQTVLRLAEGIHKKLSPLFPQGPEKTWVVLADFQDSINGYALDLPWPHIVLYLSPPSASGQLSNTDDWLSTLILHEYVHILHIYPAKSFWAPLRTIFGSWVLPNGLMPSHFHEGIATFWETKLTRAGRGAGAYFNMLRRMAVDAGRWNLSSAPLDLHDGADTLWPHGSSPYFYGYYFYEELWNRKGDKGLYELTDGYAANLPYLLNAPVRDVFGATVDEVWEGIFKKTEQSTRKEIEKIKSEPLSDLFQVTRSRYYKGELVLSPDQRKAAFLSGSPEEKTNWQVLELESRKITEKLQVPEAGGEGSCWGLKNEKETLLFIQQINSDRYALGVVSAYDFKSARAIALLDGEGKKLEHVHRIGCSADLKKILVYHEVATAGELREYIWGNGEEGRLRLTRTWKLPPGTWVTGIAVTETPWFLLRQGIHTLLFQWKQDSPTEILGAQGHLFSLQPDKSGGFYLIADIDGRNEIWSLSPFRRSLTKTAALLSGTNSFLAVGDQLLLSVYSHGGYDLAFTKPLSSGKSLSLSPVTPLNLQQERSDLEAEVSEAADYSVLSTILPTGWIPTTFFVPSGFQMGAWLPGLDLSQRHIYDLYVGYDTRGFPFADLSYQYRVTNPVNLETSLYYLPAYFISQNAFQLRWGARFSAVGKIPGWDPVLRINLLFRRTEPASFASGNQAVGIGASLNYRTGFRQTPLDISPTRGTRLFIEHAQYLAALGTDEPHFATTVGIDQYLKAPWGKSHVFYGALRAAVTEGTKLFNSYFLAGGELLFSQGRGLFLNRGFWPEIFIARRLINMNLEYRFPISRIDRGLWIWPVFLESISGALVTDATTYDWGSSVSEPPSAAYPKFYPVVHPSSGIELKSQWKFGYYMPTEIRLGLYHGFGEHGEPVYFSLGVTAGL